ncbi:uncharacterized protein LOC129911368 [Episyrphus balteatus]|uniref:uncharacterized protein LOC129911368 n=1 Tax=Episyrphus balteatus TaxID=286459 RepID=UPI0024852E0E|nr:uncharacterized protein LOC129911368 [Episyrphus balteatus]
MSILLEKKSTISNCIQWTQIFYVFVLIINTNYCIKAEQHPAEEDGPLLSVQTAINLEVNLPCDLTPATTMNTDKVQLVIWYKQGSIKPIYTFDARGRTLQQAIPWADEIVLKNKAQFLYDTNPPALKIKNVQQDDAGLYKCRVDFHKSPTRNWRVNVTVIVAPTKLTIIDLYGAAIRNNIVGPYLEGNSINLTCLSSGGIPPPKVSWWKEHALVDDSYQILPDGTVRNVLHLPNISRADLLSAYTCQASNGHIVAVLSAKVKIEMKLPPLNILLQGINHPIVAGVRTHVTCTSVGARPPPRIIWKKGGVEMRGATQSTSTDGNSTISELVLVPAPEDNEKEVACLVAKTLPSTQLDSGMQPSYENSFGTMELYLKDSRVLNVTHAPIVSLNLGAPLDANNLMSGSDVFLDCSIVANPQITRIEWYHNDKKLHSARGVLISNQTLVLQSISKFSHGKYFCLATNIQGSVSSNEVYLDVKYSPICEAQSTIIRAAIKQTINITCSVDSNPLYDLNFKWHFNNSLDNIIELPEPSSQMEEGFHNFAPSSLPLKGDPPATSSVRHNNHYKLYQHQHHKNPHHHHKTLYEKIIIQQKHHQPSSSSSNGLNNHDFHGKIHFSSVLASSLNAPLYTTLNALEENPPKRHHTYHINGNKSKIDNNHNHHQHHNDYNLIGNHDNNHDEEMPLAQMLYSNMVYTNQIDKNHRSHYDYSKDQMQDNDISRKSQTTTNMRHFNQKGGGSIKSTKPEQILYNVYPYYIESYESFGAISCIASNKMGQSQPCWYHIQPADVPDPVKSCSAHNATPSSIQIQCTPGYDGGIPQHFHIQVYDELNRQVLYNVTFKHSTFKIKSLPSDSVFVLRITSINLQGSSKLVYRLRARTLSVPLLRTASSTAVLVQLTPVLGALVGLTLTLTLVVICVVIYIKFRKKHIYRSNGNTIETLDKGGSVELLGRNLGSRRSSYEDKNPDVVPLENSDDEFHAEEEAFHRLNMESNRILCRQALSSSPPPQLHHSSNQQQQQVKKGEISLTTNPVYNVCNTPQRIQQPTYSTTCSPHLVTSNSSSNIYTRVPGRTNIVPSSYETSSITPSTSPYGSLNVCMMPLLGQSSSHLQSLQPHQLQYQKTQLHPTTSDNLRFYSYTMNP